MSDRIAVMNGGRIEQIGSPADVYDRPASAYVAGFIGQQNFFDGTLDDSGAVAVADGVLRSTRPTAATAGAATVAVRPESVTITAGEAPAGEVNALTATLMSVSRLGSYLQVVTITASGQKVMARVPWGVELPATIGTVVTCRWPADATVIYPA